MVVERLDLKGNNNKNNLTEDLANIKRGSTMPGFDRLLKGILKYRLHERAGVLKQLNNIKENHVSRLFSFCKQLANDTVRT